MDGNYKADHMKMKKPEDDVWIIDGEGYFASCKEYQYHVETAKYPKQVKSHNIDETCVQRILLSEKPSLYQPQGSKWG